MKQFPDNFGGLFTPDGGGTFTIQVVAGSGVDEALARSEIQSYSATYLGAAAPSVVDPPALTFTGASFSLATLYRGESAIQAATGELSSQGISIEGAGIDDMHNAVLVTIPAGSDQTKYTVALSGIVPSSLVELHEAGPVALFDRNHDGAPWYGGDSILVGGSSSLTGTGCTSGFGAHNSGHTATYALTAGHCTDGGTSGYPFYNVPQGSKPPYPAGQYLGTPDAQAYLTSNSNNYDIERIPASTDGYFWQGTATPEPVSNDAAPVVGNTNCIEGAVSHEQCASVTSVNGYLNEGPPGYVEGGMYTMSAVLGAPGDSGGPVVWPTIYGYIAQGAVVGGTGGLGYEEGINYFEFLLGVKVTSLSNP